MTSAASIVGAPSPIQSRALSLVLSSKQYRAAVVVAYGSPSFRCDIIHGTQIQKQPLSEIRLLYTNVSEYLEVLNLRSLFYLVMAQKRSVMHPKRIHRHPGVSGQTLTQWVAVSA